MTQLLKVAGCPAEAAKDGGRQRPHSVCYRAGVALSAWAPHWEAVGGSPGGAEKALTQ